MNFYDSLSNIWNFERLYGINYLTYQQNELKITYNSFIRSLIPGICFVILTFFGMYIYIPEESDYKLNGIGSIILAVGQIEIIVQFMNCAVVFILSFIHRKRSIKLYEKINALDEILLNKLEIYLNYRKMKISSTRRLFATHFGLFILSGIIDYAYASNKSHILLLLIYNYSAGSGLTSSLEFNNLARIIKFRLKLLNNLLIKKFDHIDTKNLEIMIKCHSTLNGLIKDVNEIYGLKQLAAITNDFVVIIVNMFAYLVSIENNFSEFSSVRFLFGSLMLPSLIMKLYFTTTNCQKAVNNKKYFGILLKNLNHSKMTEEVSHLVCMVENNILKCYLSLFCFPD